MRAAVGTTDRRQLTVCGRGGCEVSRVWMRCSLCWVLQWNCCTTHKHINICLYLQPFAALRCVNVREQLCTLDFAVLIFWCSRCRGTGADKASCIMRLNPPGCMHIHRHHALAQSISPSNAVVEASLWTLIAVNSRKYEAFLSLRTLKHKGMVCAGPRNAPG